MADEDREVPEDTLEVLAAKLKHANQLRMWHLRQGPYADPNVPPPVYKRPEPPEPEMDLTP